MMILEKWQIKIIIEMIIPTNSHSWHSSSTASLLSTMLSVRWVWTLCSCTPPRRSCQPTAACSCSGSVLSTALLQKTGLVVTSSQITNWNLIYLTYLIYTSTAYNSSYYSHTYTYTLTLIAERVAKVQILLRDAHV
jgi:hypothetical protein